MNSTHDNCKLVVFSNKAWNAIINETFRKDPVETGGILLGHILSNGYWIVMEVIPPGLKAIHQRAYFEYDTDFVNYMANSVSRQYKMELSVLGLWHRHPGSMDVFSGTDDGTNATFAQMNQYGAISGLVNIDPKFRFTLRHVAYPLHYQIVDVEVGDDLIPSQYFELKYTYGENITPIVPDGNGESPKTRIAEPERPIESSRGTSLLPIEQKNEEQELCSFTQPKWLYILKIVKRYWFVFVSLVCLIIGICIGHGSNGKNVDAAKTEQDSIIKLKEESINSWKQKYNDRGDTIGQLKDSIGELNTKLEKASKPAKKN